MDSTEQRGGGGGAGGDPVRVEVTWEGGRMEKQKMTYLNVFFYIYIYILMGIWTSALWWSTEWEYPCGNRKWVSVPSHISDLRPPSDWVSGFSPNCGRKWLTKPTISQEAQGTLGGVSWEVGVSVVGSAECSMFKEGETAAVALGGRRPATRITGSAAPPTFTW